MLVSVCEPVSVATVESIFKVAEPELAPPLNPVPATTAVISPAPAAANSLATYAFTDCCEGDLLASSDAKLSSSTIAPKGIMSLPSRIYNLLALVS